MLFEQEDYGDWEFSVERLVAASDARTSAGLPVRFDYSTLGKPFRYPPPGGVPGMNPKPLPGGKPGRPGRPARPGDPPKGPRPPLQELPDDTFDEDEGDGDEG